MERVVVYVQGTIAFNFVLRGSSEQQERCHYATRGQEDCHKREGAGLICDPNPFVSRRRVPWELGAMRNSVSGYAAYYHFGIRFSG